MPPSTTPMLEPPNQLKSRVCAMPKTFPYLYYGKPSYSKTDAERDREACPRDLRHASAPTPVCRIAMGVLSGFADVALSGGDRAAIRQRGSFSTGNCHRTFH